MSLTEVDKKISFRSKVPLPYGDHQSQDTIINGVITMAGLVDRFNAPRGFETQGTLNEVLKIMRDEKMDDKQKRNQIAQVLGIA